MIMNTTGEAQPFQVNLILDPENLCRQLLKG
jgi:hypothetical protein